MKNTPLIDAPAPGLNLYTSNRLEILAAELAALLDVHPLPPLQPEIVVVQSRGMARWLALQLAEHAGICANLSCPFPNAIVARILGILLARQVGKDDRQIITWQLMELLAATDGLPVFATVTDYLAAGTELRRYQLARQLAQLFDQYAVYRPDLVLDWEEGDGNDGWQAALWRQLATTAGWPHRAALLHQALELLAGGGPLVSGLPPRLAIFGISSLPPYHLELLAALGRYLEVNFFLLNPCREYWGDIVSGKEMARLHQRQGESALLFREEGNPLLASLGQLGRDFFNMLQELDCREVERFEPAEGGSLLATIQNDILELSTPEQKRRVREDDRSLQIHSCHSPVRELEVLKDQLLFLFEEDPTINPRDILVMAPDIENYGPLIQAVFDEPGEGGHRIPYSIADRSLRQEARLVETFFMLLELAGSRFPASRVLALLEEEAVLRRFGLEEADLELITRWVDAASIRWGWDGDCRRRQGFSAFEEHSWRAGLDRLLLGYACGGDGGQLFAGILPVSGVEGGDIAVLGRFLDFIEKLFATLRLLETPASLAVWSVRLLQLLDTFFQPDEEYGRDLLNLRQAALDLREQQKMAEFAAPVSLETVRAHLAATFDEEASPFGFLTGGVTFCAMLPMRAIPFAVVWLLGMNDADFPRQTTAVSFDLLAREPRRGDRNRRLDDRYLFLEALLSARKVFAVSYVGQSARDGGLLPPSVLTSELLDYVEAGFESCVGDLRSRLVVCHRLQQFHHDYFQKKGPLFSYDADNLTAAAALIGPRQEEELLMPVPLAATGDRFRVDAGDLGRFFTQPVRFFCEERLGLRIENPREIPADREPLKIEGLERYRLTTDLLARHLEGLTLEEQLPVARAAGFLPPGVLGETSHERLCREVRRFGDQLAGHLENALLAPLAIRLRIGDWHLYGELTDIRRHALLRSRCASIKPKDLITAWLSHLLLNAASAAGYPRESVLVGRDAVYRFAPVENSPEILHQLLALFLRGQSEPLPFFPGASLAYAKTVLQGKGEEEAMRRARRCWQGGEFLSQPAESEDEYHLLCFRRSESLAGDFARLANDFFQPLLAHLGEEEG
jgi:exodeoxyribonuclease V gamma subunit